jgi:hypothetical protein
MSCKSDIHSIMAAVAVLALCAPQLRATPVEFTIDEAQSKISLSGTVLGNAVQEQQTGSLTTSFYGKILADVGAAGIQFTGGSALTARTNGVWQPGPNGGAGSAPADYAAQATTFLGSVKGALRNIVLDLSSGVLPITSTRFDASALLFAFPTNSTASFDYDAGFLGANGIALRGISTNKIVNGATLVSASDTQTLTIAVDTEFKFKAVVDNDSSVHLTGTLVATTTAQPRITSIDVKNQSVILHVQGAGTNPQLFSSTNFIQWATRSPAQSTDTNGVVLTLPVGGPFEFYRAAK